MILYTIATLIMQQSIQQMGAGYFLGYIAGTMDAKGMGK